MEKEIKRTMPFRLATERIKYLGINLTKDAKDLYFEIIRYWRKKLTKIQINGSIYPAQGLEELTLKCPYYPKQSRDSVQFLSRYHRTRSKYFKNLHGITKDNSDFEK